MHATATARARHWRDVIRVLEKAGFSELTHEMDNGSVEMGAIPGLSPPPSC